MRGYPKTLNTKADYEYVRDNFPKSQWKENWQNLLDTMRDWVPAGTLGSKVDGIEDDTHKVTCQDKGVNEDEQAVYIQWEYQIVPTCRLLRLGFTEEEVRLALS